MNFYDEDEMLSSKFEELSDQLGYLVLDLLVISLKKVVREEGIFSEIMDCKLDQSSNNQPF
jgi:hypothetical protein